MAIDYRGIRSVTARELVAALQRDGFYFVRQIVVRGHKVAELRVGEVLAEQRAAAKKQNSLMRPESGWVTESPGKTPQEPGH
jgi:hypothetical protein